MSSKSFFVEHLEELKTTLTANSHFSQEFLQNKHTAVLRYNTEVAPTAPLKLTNEEIQLLLTLQVETVDELVNLITIITTEGMLQHSSTNLY